MKVLLVEDEAKIAAAVKKGLEIKGFAVDSVLDSDTGLSYALDPSYDVIILDLMLPGSLDGLQIAQKVREADRHTPIIILTARGSIDDRVQGLNAGADDYLIKPFSFSELYARIQALLRRPQETKSNVLSYKDLSLDPIKFIVKREDQEIKLSAKEFSLLEFLLRNAEQIMSKDHIIDHVWNEEKLVMPNTVEVYIGYLRNKIDKPFKNKVSYIRTVRGFGYKLADK